MGVHSFCLGRRSSGGPTPCFMICVQVSGLKALGMNGPPSVTRLVAHLRKQLKAGITDFSAQPQGLTPRAAGSLLKLLFQILCFLIAPCDT